MRAQQRRYDLWGAFILTLLPAVGGGIGLVFVLRMLVVHYGWRRYRLGRGQVREETGES